LAVWQIDQPTTKFKFANIKVIPILCAREDNRASRSNLVGVVFGLSWMTSRSLETMLLRADLSRLVFDSSFSAG
jgi:hypothetical protein